MKTLFAFCTALAVVAGVLIAAPLGAAPVSQEQAKTAVRNYLARTPSPLDAKVGRGGVRHARTFGRGASAFHVVALEGGGFVVTSADTELSPIIAIS